MAVTRKGLVRFLAAGACRQPAERTKWRLLEKKKSKQPNLRRSVIVRERG